MIENEFIEGVLDKSIRNLLAFFILFFVFRAARYLARNNNYHYDLWKTAFKILGTTILFAVVGVYFSFVNGISGGYIPTAITCAVLNLIAVYIERYKPKKWTT